jgi:hypothetical protein
MLPFPSCRTLAAAVACVLTAAAGCGPSPSPEPAEPSIRLLVTHAVPVASSGQIAAGRRRGYDLFAAFLERRIGQPVEVVHRARLAGALESDARRPDVVIGRADAVRADARAAEIPLRPIARLSGPADAPVPAEAAATVFIAGAPSQAARLEAALWAVAFEPDLLAALGSRAGFVPLATEWGDVRGPQRDGLSDDVPTALPPRPVVAWQKGLTSAAPAAITASEGAVIIADKGRAGSPDAWHCLEAATGFERWQHTYPLWGRQEHEIAPRAQPVICAGRAFLLGAGGRLNCVDLHSGDLLWRTHLVADLGGRRPDAGYAAAPLLVGDTLVVAPGGDAGSLVALNWRTGHVMWRTPGTPASDIPLVAAVLGGRRQIVGYDAASLGGWDALTGKRFWTLAVEAADRGRLFEPVAVGDRLLVSDGKAGLHLHAFDGDSRIRPEPVASATDLGPIPTPPIVLDGLVVACGGEALHCLDAGDGLTRLWSVTHSSFQSCAGLIGGNGHVLTLSGRAALTLVRVRPEGAEVVGRIELVPGGTDVVSHPALVRNRLYVRTRDAAYCVDLSTAAALALHEANPAVRRR